MATVGRQKPVRRALGALFACLLLLTVAPAASAQDEPAFVFPCGDGFEFTAEAGQPIAFFCGWGTQGGPGLIKDFLNAYQATLVVEDEQGDPVLSIGPDGFATLWGDPEQFPSGFDDVTCAGPAGWVVGWSYLLEGGLPEGTYTITLDESLRHPVTDGYHTCWSADGTRLVSPPDHLSSGSWEAVSTLIVED
jgi:hypothetical protein